MPELIEHGVSGFLVASQANTDLRRRGGRSAFQSWIAPTRGAHVERHFSAGRMVEDYMRLYAATSRSGVGKQGLGTICRGMASHHLPEPARMRRGRSEGARCDACHITPVARAAQSRRPGFDLHVVRQRHRFDDK